jgi:hypothetical protein
VTGRRRYVFWIALVALVVAIGGLAIANLLKFDPETVKIELEHRLAEYRRIPESDVLKRDAFLEELLATDSYRDHAKTLYREVERARARVHEAAGLELEALKTVPPFLARCRDLLKISDDEIRRLYDESRSHLANYGMTRQAAPLREAQGRLREILERQDRIDPKEVIELQKSVLTASDAGRFQDAADLIAAFRKRRRSDDYVKQIREIEEMVSRKSAAAVKPR